MNRIECEQFYLDLSQIFKSLSRVTLLNVDHETIYLKYQNLTDIGTLSHCAEVSHSYLHLQDGDVVLTNDPYSGGSLLSEPTLIVGLGTKTIKGNTPAEYLIAHRFKVDGRVGKFKNLEDEGLRIPPSPYCIRGEINTAIVEALKNHPMLSEAFTNQVSDEARKLLAIKSEMRERLVSGRLDLSKSKVKSYLNATSNEFERRIESLAEGGRLVEMPLSNKESIRLRLDHIDGHFHFDFTGTSQGEELFLTDSATIGTVVGATLSLLNQNTPVNSGIFSRFDVKAPRGCFLNATYPRSVFLGHTDGTHLLANAVIRCLATISKNYGVATSGATLCQYEIKFGDSLTFTDRLASGTGAAPKQPGQKGLSIWDLTSTNMSVEAIELKYPLTLLGTGFRSESGGSGKQAGGLGLVRSLKLLEAGELRWSHLVPPHNPEGIEGGRSALGPEMIVLHADGTKTELPSAGQMNLKRGDVLTVLSPGGGGYGAP